MRYLLLLMLFVACESAPSKENEAVSVRDYFDYQEKGVRTAGIQMIPIETPVGQFRVWTKRFGNNPRIKVLLLHGAPAMTHEYMECFESFFPQEGFEFYEYDQLGSYYSDQPTDSSLWTVVRFVEEVEQVRKAIGADSTNFYVLGNSWGGILGMEYALKYQQNMKALLVANMMASCPEYGQYADRVLAAQMPADVLKEVRALEARGDFDNPKIYGAAHHSFLQSAYHAFARVARAGEPEFQTRQSQRVHFNAGAFGIWHCGSPGQLGCARPAEGNSYPHPHDRRGT